jgi:NAD(P)-dependent dehydrogenase (short-subunit alcohol dehydrogenase family)
MKYAVVTGGSGQLGKSFIKTLIENNYFVYSIDLDKPKKKHPSIKYVSLDITSEKEVKFFFKDLKNLDLLVNNAGIGVFTPILKRTAKEFSDVMNVNLLGTFLMSQNALKIMKKKKYGKIINIGSVYGMKSSDQKIYGKSGRNNSEVYSASKAGVIMLTKYLASHFASNNIQINCISPGGIYRNQDKEFVKKYSLKTPTGRMADTKDMQSIFKMLISKDANYINGINIPVDGGFTSW